MRNLIFILILCILCSCSKNNSGCFSGYGDEITQTHQLTDFNKVEAEGRISINFIQDSLNKLDITCGENLIDNIDYYILNNTLYLKNTSKCNWARNMNKIPSIVIHYSELNYFRVDNYYDNFFLKKHIGDSLQMEYWAGSGVTNYIGETNYISVKIHAGTGSFVCKGLSQEAFMYNSGSSPIDASKMNCIKAHAHNRSNNDIIMKCDSILIAEIYHTGNVRYLGNPSQIILNVNSSGQLIKEY